ncbi:MAG: peptidyl-prolyl cis-trans isomerase [Gemmatimonadetes bacterium]|uniref:Peptidyl-prolyl cis-trans isomerase n=1 Tax=Candidatus Kutchimonas denitrificans TaxID=3056748 RepID=A0AAE4Z829_9BACT|nr:peptidyl-prolyl cis-trans isomerase [Gemmatimonadota bacterium]NIR74197.1 peptidyl-prolyl cis-trans isomerase [Candidatus Kutchimonas denitrificans]NIR99819.1 peptidyl-prolyl cis-trans isomerase [Gemmatimonadota bacterium]NIT65408.1 peptidyl-prolyl cis-trans isomerase [Gemmatimonadota bacterium]NIU51774.1 peptidyl-prolyl cis-trans isomerase [Gemmatimonadota bacterium]
MSMTPRVVLETNRGDIVMELDREAAPKTVANILWHVEQGFYDGLTFHRVIPGFMIQGGGFTGDMDQRVSSRPPVENEAKNGLSNVRGSVALARRRDPHSGSTQFFINVVDNPNLDYSDETDRGWGYAVFGHVVEGMDVVDAIAAVETRQVGPHEAVPVDPVVIEDAYVAE